MFTLLRDDCDTPDAIDAPAPAAVPQDNFSARLPRPRSSPLVRNYRGIFDEATARQLARAADSGAALECVAPTCSSSAETGAPQVGAIGVVFIVAGLAYLFR